jgi:hypothetical protein
MSSIYWNVVKVLVWLSEESSDESTKAFKELGYNKKAYLRLKQESKDLDKLKETFSKVAGYFRSSWFERVWTR